MLQELARDVRYALRTLGKSPGFTATVVGVLALGIGANTAMFSAVDAAFLRPLPFREPERLVRVTSIGYPVRLGESFDIPKSGADFRDLKGLTTAYDGAAAFATGNLNLVGGAEPLRVVTTFASPNLFEVLGRAPALGRSFAPEEDAMPGVGVAILSDGLWRRAFGGDRAVIGKQVQLNANSYTIIGVMPSDFRFPAKTELWVPLPERATSRQLEAFRNYIPTRFVARLRPGVTPEAAAAQTLALIRRARTRPGGEDPELAKLVLPLQTSLVGDRKLALLVLMASAGLVLLIACANVSNLLLARAASRRREVAVRVVLGATRGRIVQQLFVESVVLAVGGAALGLLLAWASMDALNAVMPAQLAGVVPPSVDLRLLGFSVLLSIATAVVFGLWPALGSARGSASTGSGQSLAEAIKSGGGYGTTEREGARTRSALAVVEVALAMVLLVGTALMLKSFQALVGTDTGIRAEQVVTAQLTLPQKRTPNRGDEAAFFQRAVDQLRAAPGVTAAGAVNILPLGEEQGISTSVDVPGKPRRDDERWFAQFLTVTPGYFQAMGMPLLRGRDFTAGDDSTTRAVVINQTMAQAIWPGEDPLGRQLEGVGGMRTVVGVVGDARTKSITDKPDMQTYLPMRESAQSYGAIIVRGDAPAPVLMARIRDAVRAIDPTQPVYNVRRMDEVVSASVAPQRTNTLLITTFGALALVLAGLGVYGVLAYGVARRTREIGIRVALGARLADVVSLVLRQGATIGAIGVVLGLGASLALSRLIESLLYGVKPHDTAVFVAAPVVVFTLALLAAWVPARRAARVDPMRALRAE